MGATRAGGVEVGPTGPSSKESGPTTHTRDDPVVAWRYWQLSPRRLLRSVTQKRFEWTPGEPLRAVCLEAAHPPPEVQCNCGVYGTLDFDELREHGLCLAPQPLVVGQVALWGAVVGDDRTCRGQFGYPARLSLVVDTVPVDLLDEVTANLGRYGVPVDTTALDEAVAGASATMLRMQAMSWQASTTGVDATPRGTGRD